MFPANLNVAWHGWPEENIPDWMLWARLPFQALFIWIAFTFNTLVLYIFTNSLPLMFDFAHQSREVGSHGLRLFSGGGVLGSIGGAFLMGLWGSRGVGTVAAFIGAVAAAVAPYHDAGFPIRIAVATVSGCSMG